MIRRFLIAFLVAVTIPLVALAQSQPQHEHGATQTQPSSQDQRQQMMQMHQQMMAEMAAADQKLDSLVSQMNAAQGPAKVDAIAAVVTELVNQQKQMHAHMRTMMKQGGMMMGGQKGPGR